MIVCGSVQLQYAHQTGAPKIEGSGMVIWKPGTILWAVCACGELEWILQPPPKEGGTGNTVLLIP